MGLAQSTSVPRLRRDVAFRLTYEDKTGFGGPIGRRADDSVREIFQPVLQFVQDHGFANLIARSPDLLRACVASDAFRRICQSIYRNGWTLHPEILYPDPRLTRPATLIAYRAASSNGIELSLSGDDWPRMHDDIAQLCEGATGELEFGTVFERAGFLETGAETARIDDDTELTFVGHNAVLARTRSASVLIDPFLFPHGPQYSPSYQPLTMRDLGRLSAVLITHSHPDHFDPVTLLQIPRDTLMIVPHGANRENLLSQDIGLRLRELGFERCEALAWNHSIRVGDIEVHALPFYGEQPSDTAILHSEVRNAGNTYGLRTPGYTVVFVADSGRDAAGDVRRVAGDWVHEFGPIDVLFSGYRGWFTYPAQLLFSSVARFLLFVPPELWGTRLQLMNSIADAIDLAERWGARYLVPYGDGGAPWHWEIGLGPRLDGSGVEDPCFDPFPERVAEEAGTRVRFPDGSSGGSRVETLLLRPGDSIKNIAGSVEVLRIPGHAWPYTARTRHAEA